MLSKFLNTRPIQGAIPPASLCHTSTASLRPGDPKAKLRIFRICLVSTSLDMFISHCHTARRSTKSADPREVHAPTQNMNVALWRAQKCVVSANQHLLGQGGQWWSMWNGWILLTVKRVKEGSEPCVFSEIRQLGAERGRAAQGPSIRRWRKRKKCP